jgi:hypothetical protein
MIGWTPCEGWYACNCKDEDQCWKAPKNVALRASREPAGEFCPGNLGVASCLCDTGLHGPKTCKYHDQGQGSKT